jgi:hypothetical protein
LLAGRSNPGRGKILFAFPNVQAGSEAYRSTYSLDSFPWAKWIGREVDHSPPSSAMYKHEWSYTFAPPDAFMTWVGTTLRCPLFECTEELDTVISTVECIIRSGVNRGQIQRVLEDVGSIWQCCLQQGSEMAECSGEMFFICGMKYVYGKREELWQLIWWLSVSWLAFIVDVIRTLLNSSGKG